MTITEPRTGDSPLEVIKEGRAIIMRALLEGGSRLVLEIMTDEVGALGGTLADARI